MKNSILIVLAGSIICLFFTKCNRHLHQNAESTGYPAATKYATILYATEVNTKEGNITNLAGHSVLKGNGQFTWEQQINAEGEYEMILSYSVRKDGAAVLVGSDKNTASGAIEITKGVYETGTEWYRFNCERKLLPGKLVLKKGINSIALKVNAPDQNFETVIYTLELVPENKKISVLKDIARAKSSRPQMNWFSSMKYGVMFHWTSLTTPPSGPLKPYSQAVRILMYTIS